MLKNQSPQGGKLHSNIVNFPAPEWSVENWIHSEPLALKDLRGKLVLIRWWTGPGCPYCTPAAPILSDLYHRYQDRGLTVVGFYHHKSRDPLIVENVRRMAGEMGIDFPVAVDPGWQTLKRYWLDRGPEKAWTSVSFLIDRDGIVRYVHPGGAITKEEAREIENKILSLIDQGKEKPR